MTLKVSFDYSKPEGTSDDVCSKSELLNMSVDTTTIKQNGNNQNRFEKGCLYIRLVAI